MNLLDEYIKETQTSAKASSLIKNIKNNPQWNEKKNENNENILMLAFEKYPQIVEKLLNTKEGKEILKEKNKNNEGLMNYFLTTLKNNDQLTIFDYKYINKLITTPFEYGKSYISSFNSKREIYDKEGKIQNLLSYLSKKISPSFILGSEYELNKEMKKDLEILNSEKIVDLKKIEKYSLIFDKIDNDIFVETVKKYSKETQAFFVLYLALQNDRKYLNLGIDDLLKPQSMSLQEHVINTGDVKMIFAIFEKNELNKNITNTQMEKGIKPL